MLDRVLRAARLARESWEKMREIEGRRSGAASEPTHYAPLDTLTEVERVVVGTLYGHVKLQGEPLQPACAMMEYAPV